MLYALSISLIFTFCIRTDAELFTSVEALKALLITEQRIIDDLDSYIHKEEERLSILKRYLRIFQREHDKAMEDIPNYMGNSINAYTLIKRLTTDLDYINDTIKLGNEHTNIMVEHRDVLYPTTEDLTGAALALSRLQKMYHLDVNELAEGKLNGVTYSTPMTACDCYEIGGELYDDRDYKSSRAWMLQAFRKYYEENVAYSFTDNDILDYINNTCYRIGDPKDALEWTRKVLEINPTHLRSNEIVQFYQTLSDAEDAKLKEVFETAKQNGTVEKKAQITKELTIMETYEGLCRGDLEVPIELSSRLTCRYLTENDPYLRIAPFKIEMMYLNPDMVLFHDILSNAEIEEIKQLARPKFQRALVTANNGTSVIARSRVSKLAWLADQESPTIERIRRRVTYMTGLTTATADKFQVLNYGIGGHYEPHFDFFVLPANSSGKGKVLHNGNRIATLLFYMSDVALGGATVFPSLGVRMVPVKGTAILWYNLHASGATDIAMRHAACPMLQGSKWVFTKWFYQVGQEFLKPCNLENQPTDYHTSKLLKPVEKSYNQIVQESSRPLHI